MSETHHRLELQLDDVSMSESPESEQAARGDDHHHHNQDHHHRNDRHHQDDHHHGDQCYSELNLRDGQETNSVMRDWLLVATGGFYIHDDDNDDYNHD